MAVVAYFVLNGNIKLGVGLIVIYAAVALMRHFTEPKLVSSRIGMNPILTLMSMYIVYRTLSIGGYDFRPDNTYADNQFL